MTVFDRYLEQAKDFTRKLVRTETGTRRWATVTSVDPLLITYDGPAPQGIISPVVLGTPVTLGDRVRAHTIGDRTYITRANPTPVDDTGWVEIPVSTPTIAPVEARKIGDTVRLRGIPDGGGLSAGYTEIGTLPNGFHPPQNYYFPVVTNSWNVVFRLRVLSSGAIEVDVGSSPRRFYVDSINYLVED